MDRVKTELVVPVADTYFALLSVQVELVLADGHDPNSLDQRVGGIPRVNE